MNWLGSANECEQLPGSRMDAPQVPAAAMPRHNDDYHQRVAGDEAP